ncbi:hypothetical protein G9E11_15390 [Arthrobacter sp. IA7]|uniref:hypothetical protein n=1 Tax=Arthrobacter ipis TaxID=2716202 RepID=UPI001686FE84|nr:hypothetical protein [Arthrobacter ipis]MBD1543595.1 hypothetical protein [Arthrobacter ipis]
MVGSVRDLSTITTAHIYRRDRLDTSDAYLLFRRTMAPSPVWLPLFSATIGWAWLSAYGSFRHLIAAAVGSARLFSGQEPRSIISYGFGDRPLSIQPKREKTASRLR